MNNVIISNIFVSLSAFKIQRMTGGQMDSQCP